jgi:hypothetical protein
LSVVLRVKGAPTPTNKQTNKQNTSIMKNQVNKTQKTTENDGKRRKDKTYLNQHIEEVKLKNPKAGTKESNKTRNLWK